MFDNVNTRREADDAPVAVSADKPAKRRPRSASAKPRAPKLPTALQQFDLLKRVVDPRATIEILKAVRLDKFDQAVRIHATDMDVCVSVLFDMERWPGFKAAQSVAADKLCHVKAVEAAIRRHADDAKRGDDAVKPGGLGQYLDEVVAFQRSASGGTVCNALLTDWPGGLGYRDAKHELIARYVVDAAELARVWRWIYPAVSTEETRYYLNGIYMHPRRKPVGSDGQSHRLQFVATDGHRLHADAISYGRLRDGSKPADPMNESTASTGCIVPRKTVELVLRACEMFPDKMVEVDVEGVRSGDYHCGAVCFRIGPVLIRSKTIDGTFPDYDRVVPTPGDADKRFVWSADAASRFVSDVKAARLDAESAGANRGSMLPVGLQSNEPDDAVAWTFRSGERLTLGAFNSRYLVELLDEDSAATLRLPDPGSPARIAFDAYPDRLAVLMPVRM